MKEISVAEAIARAQDELGFGAAIPVKAWHVRRLDHPDDAYYLVVIGEEQNALAVAAVGAKAGEIRTSARLSSGQSPLRINKSEAINFAGEGASNGVELVWQPCVASRSPLYPLWLVRTSSGSVYVDQQGNVWKQLNTVGRGGAA
jgi:hypothetical protein